MPDTFNGLEREILFGIEYALEKQEMTYKQIGREAGLSLQTVSRFHRGTRISDKSLLKIHRWLKTKDFPTYRHQAVNTIRDVTENSTHAPKATGFAGYDAPSDEIKEEPRSIINTDNVGYFIVGLFASYIIVHILWSFIRTWF